MEFISEDQDQVALPVDEILEEQVSTVETEETILLADEESLTGKPEKIEAEEPARETGEEAVETVAEKAVTPGKKKRVSTPVLALLIIVLLIVYSLCWHFNRYRYQPPFFRRDFYL